MFIHVEDGNTGYDIMVAVDMIATVEKVQHDFNYTVITLKDGRHITTSDSIKTIDARIERAKQRPCEDTFVGTVRQHIADKWGTKEATE